MNLFRKLKKKTTIRKTTFSSSNDYTTHIFNEFLIESTENQNNIHLVSDVPVNITASADNKLSAHLHGETNCKDIRFYITILDDEIKIVAKYKPATKDFVIHSLLTLDIEVPLKEFNNIKVEAKNSSIVIASNVTANSLNILNCNGKTNVFATFKNLTINAINGSIVVNSNPKSDTKLNLSTHNGSINISLKDSTTANISTKTVNGSCRNNFKPSSIYIATGQAFAKNGYIDIC